MATFLKERKASSAKRIIYLDQNIWYYLAQVYYGKSEDPNKKVYKYKFGSR